MRRADIEVPNLAVDVTLRNYLRRRLYLHLLVSEMVACYGGGRFTVVGSHLHPSLMREVVTGEARRSQRATFPRYYPTEQCAVLAPLPRVGLHRYEPLCTARSLERGATLTLGQDQPVIPGVAFIR
jgi:hypothetical protein